MDVGQVTQLGLAVGGFATGATGIVVAILNRRTARDTTALSQAELDERQRQYDVSTLIKELRETASRQDKKVDQLETRMEETRREHEATIAKLEDENRQCWADRAQLTNQVTYQRMQLDDMRRRLTQLEKPDQV